MGFSLGKVWRRYLVDLGRLKKYENDRKSRVSLQVRLGECFGRMLSLLGNKCWAEQNMFFRLQKIKKHPRRMLRLACDHRVKLETSFVTVAIDPQYPQLQFFRSILVPVPIQWVVCVWIDYVESSWNGFNPPYKRGEKREMQWLHTASDCATNGCPTEGTAYKQGTCLMQGWKMIKNDETW